MTVSRGVRATMGVVVKVRVQRGVRTARMEEETARDVRYMFAGVFVGELISCSFVQTREYGLVLG